MTADPERQKSPPIPLNTDETGEEDMMSFITTHIESILKPYADNVYELHNTILDLSNNVSGLQQKAEVNDARVDGMQEGQDKLKHFAKESRHLLDGFIDRSKKDEQERIKTHLAHVKEGLAQVKGDMADLQKNHEYTYTKLIVCQNAEEANRDKCVKLRSELQRVAENLRRTDESHAGTINTVASHKSSLDTEVTLLKLANQELEKKLGDQFTAQYYKNAQKLNLLDAQFAEHQAQLKQYYEEFKQAREATTQSLLAINEEWGPVHKETKAQFHRIHLDLLAQTRATDGKIEDLSNRMSSEGQQQKEEMDDVRQRTSDLEAIASDHESKVNALNTATGIIPGRLKNRWDLLDEDADFNTKRFLRLEKTLGLEPLTKEMADTADSTKRKQKKRASTMMLGDDQLTRKAWSAWMEAIVESRQNKMADAVMNVQETLQRHQKLLENEKSELDSTKDKVQNLEDQVNTKVLEEMQTLRKSLNLNDGYWKGMTRGLQATKTKMHTEGDGEMLPSAMRLRNALSSRPQSSRPLSSLVSQLPNPNSKTL